ncbi:MAG: DUF433 domain-containing protein [Planctomycetota bacterium]
MNHWSNCEAVERVAGKVSGVWVFCNTRVPLSALFENLRDGASADEFVEWFPGVSRSQVDAVLAYEYRI